VFEDRVVRRILGRRWDEVTGEWKRVHNEEINDLSGKGNAVPLQAWTGPKVSRK
jgi:hypothetical protein